MRRVSNMTAGGRKKSQRAMVVAGNYDGVAGNKLGLPRVILEGHATLHRSRVGPLMFKRRKLPLVTAFLLSRTQTLKTSCTICNSFFQLQKSAFFLCFVFVFAIRYMCTTSLYMYVEYTTFGCRRPCNE